MRYAKSQAALARLRAVTPGGAQTLSKRAERFTEGSFPVTLTRGTGAHVYDIDGNKYLDMICGLASMTLGYSNQYVHEAVQYQLSRGVTFSLATEREAEVAEKIIDIIPCAESVRFVKTGSESTEAAIRVARKFTGRDIILTVRSGYHTWHSWGQVIKPEHPGIPPEYAALVRSFRYNDLSDLANQFAVCAGSVAAVIMEPCHYDAPSAGFLDGVRKLCNENNALLILDEMITGFRWANGGAQKYFGITPDLATFGKACANGYPLAFLCGKREIMQHADVVSGTFGGECLSLAACSAVLDIYREHPIIETLWKLGRQFQVGVNTAIMQLDVPAVCDGYAVKPRIRFPCNTDMQNNLALSLFVQELAAHGVLWHPAGGNISAAMTELDIGNAIDACCAALYVVRTALRSSDWSRLKGKPIQATSFVRTA